MAPNFENEVKELNAWDINVIEFPPVADAGRRPCDFAMRSSPLSKSIASCVVILGAGRLFAEEARSLLRHLFH